MAPIEKSTRNRILRNVFFVGAWCCMLAMWGALASLAMLVRWAAERWDMMLPAATLLVSHPVFLCFFGLLVLAALIKEPFMASDRMSFLTNSVWLLVVAWVFVLSVWSLFACCTNIDHGIGG